MIIQFFCNCFNLSVPPLSTTSGDSCSEDCPSCPSYLLCSNIKVAKLLLQIPSNTSTCPDGISAHMLRETAYSISSPLTSIFNLSIKSGIFPDDWKTLILFQYQSTLQLHLLPQVIVCVTGVKVTPVTSFRKTYFQLATGLLPDS